MKRTYNSQRRAANAERTRQAIVEAAVKLHGEGVTTLSAVADAAGVSLPTVNKHFPTREDLFDACTQHHRSQLEAQEPEDLATISDRGERLYQVVLNVHRIHEQSFGQSWTGYKLEDESPTLASAMQDYERSVADYVDAALQDWTGNADDAKTTAAFVRGLLNPLTYRALRLKNGLSFDEATAQIAKTLACTLNIQLPESRTG
jgi:AcrR family transcriptional regulator